MPGVAAWCMDWAGLVCSCRIFFSHLHLFCAFLEYGCNTHLLLSFLWKTVFCENYSFPSGSSSVLSTCITSFLLRKESIRVGECKPMPASLTCYGVFCFQREDIIFFQSTFLRRQGYLTVCFFLPSIPVKSKNFIFLEKYILKTLPYHFIVIFLFFSCLYVV